MTVRRKSIVVSAALGVGVMLAQPAWSQDWWRESDPKRRPTRSIKPSPKGPPPGYRTPPAGRTPRSRPATAARWYRRGVKAYRQGRYQRARLYFSRAIAKNPKMARAYNNRGATYHKLARFREAIRDYTKAIRLSPRYAQAYYNRGWAHHLKGDLPRAIGDYTQAVRLRPGYTKARRRLAEARIRLRAKSAASRRPRAPTAGRPATSAPSRSLAYRYNRTGLATKNFQQKVYYYTRAIQADPGWHIAWNNRAFSYRQLRQYKKALADVNQAIWLKGDYALAWYNRGVIHRRMGKYNRAIADYTTTIRLKPDYAPAWQSRGFALGRIGQYQRAVADYTRAIRLKPRYDTAWHNRGFAYFKLGQYRRALSDLTRAIRISPDPVSFKVRAKVYEAMGQWGLARADRRAASRGRRR